MRLLLVIFGSILSVSRAQQECYPGALESDDFGRCYQVMNKDFSYSDATGYCHMFGGTMVSIKNAFENALIVNYALQLYSGKQFWIGADEIGTPQDFKWQDNTPFIYTNWDTYEPSTLSTDQCAYINGQGRWGGSTCSVRRPFICYTPFSYTNCTKHAEPSRAKFSKAVEGSKNKLAPNSAAAEKCKAACDSGWTYYEAGESCFKKFQGDTYKNAQSGCRSVSARLASIHSDDENDFVYSLVRAGSAFQDVDPLVWLGLSYVNGNYQWDDRSSVNYLKWGSGHPQQRFKTNAVVMVADPGSRFSNVALSHWATASGDVSQRSYVCKKAAGQL